MLELLCEAITNGYGKAIDGKIRPETFADAIRKLNEKMGTSISKKHVENHMKTQRTKYKNYKIIAEQSGWGPQFICSHTDAERGVWSEFVEKHPEMARYGGKSCPMYEQLQSLLASNTATSSNSMQPSDFA